MGRGEDGYDNYVLPHLDYESATASSDSEPMIPFTFGGKEAVETGIGYTELAFAVFAQGYLIVLIH